jgi:outer membrane lipoprotein-sorting protein
MTIHKKTVILLVLILTAVLAAQGNLTDPYQIINRNIEASGGLERLRAEHTQYMEGKLEVASLKGSIKVWTEKPGKSRTEVDLGVIKMTQGDNGKAQWVLDSNGKLQMITNPDSAAIKRRQLREYMQDFDYVDPNSKIFKVSYVGIQPVDGQRCYVIRIANTINNDVDTNFIDVKDFLLMKNISIAGEESSDSYYKDYRKVEGIMVPFWTKQVARQTGQVQEITLTKYESNPEIDPSLFKPPGETIKDYQFVNSDKAENIPFRLIDNHLFIPAIVDCHERMWVLDTGASMSVVNAAFADELGLVRQGDMKGRGAGGTVKIEFATLPSLTVKGIKFDPQTVAVIDMSELTRLLGIDIAGILGYDFLSRFVTKIDYADELVSFYDPATFKYAGQGHELKMHVKGSVFTVDATLDDDHGGSWLFDLGASRTSLDAAYAVHNGYAARKGVLGLGHGAANYFTTKAVRCDSIDVAGYQIDNPVIGFHYGGTDTTTQSDEVGTLGNTLFRNFVVYADYVGERLILEPGRNFNRSFPRDGSGLQFILGGDGEFEVLYVSEGSPAAKAGFKKGDIVRKVNGIDVAYLENLPALRAMLRTKPGTEYKFVIDRDGKEKKLKFKLKKLL